MTRLDTLLLDVTEWSCRRLQSLTGRTSVWLAVQLTNLSTIVYFVWAAAYFWNRVVWPRLVIGVFCAGLLYVLAQTVFKVPIEASEEAAYRRVARGIRNPRRVRDAPLRIAFATLSLLLVYPAVLVYVNLDARVILLTYPLVVLTTAVLYLLACDPLPPPRGRRQESRARGRQLTRCQPGAQPLSRGR